jgi:hypothetical protein
MFVFVLIRFAHASAAGLALGCEYQTVCCGAHLRVGSSGQQGRDAARNKRNGEAALSACVSAACCRLLVADTAVHARASFEKGVGHSTRTCTSAHPLTLTHTNAEIRDIQAEDDLRRQVEALEGEQVAWQRALDAENEAALAKMHVQVTG